MAKTEAERQRAIDMAARWDQVVMRITRLISRRGLEIPMSPGIVELADALVQAKSEEAYRADYSDPLISGVR